MLEPETAAVTPLPPLTFEPILKTRAWGGNRLSRYHREIPPAGLIGESWDLADLPPQIKHGRSIVASGPMSGLEISEILKTRRPELLGSIEPSREGGFPLLVKLLDAKANLSVQVHPDQAYTDLNPGTHVKNECWFILEAEKDACVYRGIDPDLDPEEFRQFASQGNRLLEHLVRIPVEAGDCIRLQSGICHALGAGVLAVEYQTPSDTTFRVWDWNRQDPKRPLHLEEAMACTAFGEDQDDGRPAFTKLALLPKADLGGRCVRRICSTEDFSIDHVTLPAGEHALPSGPGPLVATCVHGSTAVMSATSDAVRLRKGTTALIPAAARDSITVTEESAQLLLVELEPAADHLPS